MVTTLSKKQKYVLSGTLYTNIFIGHRYMADILPIRRNRLSDQSIIGAPALMVLLSK